MATIDPEGTEERALDELVDMGGKSLLEIGSGDGRLTWRLAARAKSVLTVESQEALVRLARETYRRHPIGRVRFEWADATSFRYPRNRFDLAVLSYSL